LTRQQMAICPTVGISFRRRHRSFRAMRLTHSEAACTTADSFRFSNRSYAKDWICNRQRNLKRHVHEAQSTSETDGATVRRYCRRPIFSSSPGRSKPYGKPLIPMILLRFPCFFDWVCSLGSTVGSVNGSRCRRRDETGVRLLATVA